MSAIPKCLCLHTAACSNYMALSTQQILPLIAAIFWLTGQPLYAQRLPRMEWGFQNDNDLYLFNRQDQYYTNGLVLTVSKAADSTALASHESNRIWSVYAGQKLYNAYTGQIHSISEVDRPITAYLFAGISRSAYYTKASMLTYSVELGTIGRRAFGQQTQEAVHRALHLYAIAGWQYQLNNAFGADIRTEYAKQLYRTSRHWFDLTWHASGTLGLNHTNLGTAASFRIGRLNPISVSAYFSSRLQARPHTVANELFLYYKPEVNWIGYDATIQGGIFLDDKGPVARRPARWTMAHQAGLVYAQKAFTCSLQYRFSTREVPTMYFRHQYGSLAISYRY